MLYLGPYPTHCPSIVWVLNFLIWLRRENYYVIPGVILDTAGQYFWTCCFFCFFLYKGKGGGGEFGNGRQKLIDSTFTASDSFPIGWKGVIYIMSLLESYRTIPMNTARVLHFLLKLEVCFKIPTLETNDDLQRFVTGEPYLVSKNVRKLRCRKFYPEYFSIKVFLKKKKKKIMEIYKKRISGAFQPTFLHFLNGLAGGTRL